MQNDKIYFEIIKSLKTRQEVDEFIGEIDVLSESLYAIDPNTFQNAIAKVKAVDASLLRDALVKVPDKGVFLRELRARATSLKPILITLAYNPGADSLKKIKDWVFSNLGEDILLDIEVNPEIIAGAAISFGGKFVDNSLLRMLKEKFNI